MRTKKKFYVVAYDIKDDGRRVKVGKLMEQYGIRANFSVFECLFTDKQLAATQEDIERLIDKTCDSVIFYPVCIDCFAKIKYFPERSFKAKVVNIV